MIEFQRFNTTENNGIPTVRFSFDETAIAEDWQEVQHYVDFLGSIGMSASVISALQTVIDANYTPAP